jgi:hypothetical protein
LVKNGELDLQTGAIWDLDYLSGHFARNELFSWIKNKDIPYMWARLMTVIRHPLEQLQSNLSFPFELQERDIRIQEPWMIDLLQADPRSPVELCDVLNKHRWLLNIQWQYIVTGLSLEEALVCFDHISIFPSATQSIIYAGSVLSEYPLLKNDYHENKTRKKFVDKDVFCQKGLKEIIINEHRSDRELYIRVIRERLNTFGLASAIQFVPDGPEKLFENWVTC